MNTTKVQVATAEGIVLNWMVAKAQKEDKHIHLKTGDLHYKPAQFSDEEMYTPSTNPTQGHHILEDHDINVIKVLKDAWSTEWAAFVEYGQSPKGPFEFNEGRPFYFVPLDGVVLGSTMLIAGLRAYVISELGTEVDVPTELVTL